MLDLKITTMETNNGLEFKLPAAYLTFPGQLSTGIVVHVNTPAEWDGLTQRVTFFPLGGAREGYPCMPDPEAGCITVTAAITQNSGAYIADAWNDDKTIHYFTDMQQFVVLDHLPAGGWAEKCAHEDAFDQELAFAKQYADAACNYYMKLYNTILDLTGAQGGKANLAGGNNFTGNQNVAGNVDVDGDVYAHNLKVSGNATLNGTTTVHDLVVNGTQTNVNPIESISADNEHVLRYGVDSALADDQLAGFVVKKYDGTNDGGVELDNSGTMRLGDKGDMRPAMVRAEAEELAEGHLIAWEAQGQQGVDSGIDAATLTAAAYQTYSHTKSGTVHTLTPIGDELGATGLVFVSTAGFSSGDTFVVMDGAGTGTNYTCKTQDGQEMDSGYFAAGYVVECRMNGGVLTFKSGGGVKLSAIAATSAVVGDVLQGKTFFGPDNTKAAQTGTMPNNGAFNQSLGINGSVTIPAGYHNGEGKINQSIAVLKAKTYYAKTEKQTINAKQYLSGNQVLAALSGSGWSASNVKRGVTISVNNGNSNVFSVSGTYMGPDGALAAFFNAVDHKVGFSQGSYVNPTYVTYTWFETRVELILNAGYEYVIKSIGYGEGGFMTDLSNGWWENGVDHVIPNDGQQHSLLANKPTMYILILARP